MKRQPEINFLGGAYFFLKIIAKFFRAFVIKDVWQILNKLDRTKEDMLWENIE
jgi:hypothetical protein